MSKVRVIPILLLKHWGLEKSIRFKDYVYVGSPINAARVFSNFNVDELFLLDIAATPEKRTPNLDIVAQIAEETRMPLTVGGGIKSLDTIRDLLRAGADRVSINTHAIEHPEFVRQAADQFGSQCIVASIDVKRTWLGRYEVHTHCGKTRAKRDPVECALEMQAQGAGEILLNAIDRDGTMEGYDLPLVRSVADALSIPLIACGGAGSVEHLAQVVDEGHASAVAGGAFFLFYGPRRTVLLTYPTDDELTQALGSERVRRKDLKLKPPERVRGS
ncbi:MAG: imidazole glycerol phosphate synthase subunit HisF [Candidatus Hydrogenedens sp.]|nr:imidazole glycerol phosphate synthase subunit HisF [Candidatus Hydrogenedens sp.]